MNKKSRSCTTRLLVLLLSLLGFCSLLAVLSASGNRYLPGEENSDILSSLDKARLSEALHLKAALGDEVWQGWGSADIPVIVWNRSYEFLINNGSEAPSGWSVVDDSLNGKPYFSRKAEDPQNFAVRLGDRWAASMATKQTTDVFLIQAFRDNLPAPIKQIFPYRVLIQPSETQIGGLLHETFHVYQYLTSPTRMDKAESIHKLGADYQNSAELFRSEWKKESALLADALKANSPSEKIELVRQFLGVREERRKKYGLSSDLVDYERWLEWEEGTAKYLEVAILRRAGETDEYQAIPEMKLDPEFNHYQKVDQRWSQELMQLRYQTTSGESQLYMTGLAQAFLLDDLRPDWKDQYWEEEVFLEDLLREAVTAD